MMDRLERKIKEKLQNQHVDIDTDELWNEVYPHIKPKRNRRAFVFLLIGLFWFFSVVGVGWYFSSGAKVEIADKGDQNVQLTTQNSMVQNDKELTKDDYQEKQVDKDFQQSSLKNENELNIATEKKSQELDLNNPIVSRTFIGTPNQNTEITQDPNQKLFSQEPAIIFDTKEEVNTGDADGSEIKESTSNIEIVSKEDIQEYFPTTILSSSIRPLDFNYDLPVLAIDQADFKPEETSRISFYALGGVYTTNKLLDLASAEPSADLSARLNNEKPLESISAEFGISYRLTDKISLSAGLNYLRINEKVSGSYSVTDTVLLENVIIETIISSRGSEPVFGNIQAERTVSTDLQAFNRYTDISLNFDLMYRLSQNRLSPYFSIGVQQSLSSMQAGYWLDSDDILYDIAEDEDEFLSNKYGLGLRAGVGFLLEISDRASFQLGAKYLQQLSPITNQNYTLTQQYNLLGLQAGFTVKL